MCYAVSFNVSLSSTDIVRGCVCVSFNVPLSVGLLLCVWTATDIVRGCMCVMPLSVGLRVHVCVSFNVPLSVGLLLTSSEGVCMLYCLID